MAISSSTNFKNLTYLDVSQNDLKASGAQILAVSQNLYNLQHLNITHNKIEESGFRCLADSESFPLLNNLVIYSGNHITQDCKKYLHRSKKMNQLNHIS